MRFFGSIIRAFAALAFAAGGQIDLSRTALPGNARTFVKNTNLKAS